MDRMVRGRVAGAGLALAVAVAVLWAEAARAGDWQVWIPPEGRSDNPPPYDQWERFDEDADDLKTLEECRDYVFDAQDYFLDDESDYFEALDVGICFNRVTKEIQPAVEE